MVDVPGAAELFDRVLDVWRGGDPLRIRDLVTDDYQGHMLHLADGERSADRYPDWIARYQRNNPGCTFEVLSQNTAGDRLWTRLDAHLPDGRVAHGMNTSVTGCSPRSGPSGRPGSNSADPA